MSTAPKTDTREAIMSAARLTVQSDGYNALSFRDLATAVGIKSASVHHHFPTKGDLAEALVCRFSQDFVARMEPLAEKTFEEAIDGYVSLFRGAFDGANRMCLGGMMSAEVSALPEAARKRLEDFAQAHKTFLRNVLTKKHPRLSGDRLDARAMAIYTAMEGAQLITRGLGGDVKIFDDVVEVYRSTGLLD
ncbi:TetR/AcrR family transcriptional regulator [Novosphingobium terrae]|uniref:TetR/AcrR family transcriptional regulator n=1 Tax=Novosphingobium terrae TaxID=2726189 RepID=UPI00198045CC|nr:TetR/AcrR family transcriptional regulator [Novosphingobium terrae]